MSGSPKYSEIRLREAEERRLAEERRRRAEDERRRREEAERRARLELVAGLRASLDQEATRLRDAVAALRSEVASTGSTLSVPQVEPMIDAAERSGGDRPESLALSLGQVRAIAASVGALRHHVSQQARVLAAQREALHREAEAEARRLAEAARSQEAERQRRAVETATQLRARIEGMQADEVTMAWARDEVLAVLAEITALDDASDPTLVARSLGARLDAALAHAQERQLAEEKRAYIVAALQEGLRQQGFQVGDARLLGDDSSGGEVAFRAVRADRRWVDVHVPREGHVFYDVDGTDRVTERGGDGLSYTSCDDTEARLEAVHADMAERFGVEAGELLWESKDPERERRNANELPSGGPAASRKRG